MTDAWSERKRRRIMNLCVNSKMGTMFLSSKESSSEAHKIQRIYDYVESCIQQVGPENVVQVVTDNATNNMGVAKLLKEKRPYIFWTSCSTRTINHMLEGIYIVLFIYCIYYFIFITLLSLKMFNCIL